ncbi:MAG: hypothetical protein ACRDS9_09210 [Pseudonocardiaceae bacterium]
MIVDHVAESPSAGSTPAETFRAALPGRTPEGELSTLIVTRQGLGRDGRVWLTFNGAIRTTVVLTDGETGQLVRLLDSAKTHRPGETGKSQD